MNKWREKTFPKGHPYTTNDNAFRETLIARVMTGDEGAQLATDDVIAEVGRYEGMLGKKPKVPDVGDWFEKFKDRA